MKIPLLLIASLAATALQADDKTDSTPKPPAGGVLRGIVFVISDGTSQELLTAARLYEGGANGTLVLDSYPASAFVTTRSVNDLVTDSAAAATAYARGIKADNHVIGMAAPTSSNAPASLLDLAHQAGWVTATVTDDSFTGATPAPFETEWPDRNQHPLIAAGIVSSLGKRVDVVLGGGTKWVSDMGPVEKYAAGEVETVRKTASALGKSPVVTFTNWEEFSAYTAKGHGVEKPVLGTFCPDVFSYYADGTRTLRVRDMAEGALNLLLKSGKPFFLMLEAGLPDKACHRNQAKRALVEVGELDAMLAMLRDKLPSGVLVVVTTDHNNGGFALNGPIPANAKGDMLLGLTPVNNSSTITFATGPGGPQLGTGRQGDDREPSDPEHVQPATVFWPSSEHTGGDVWLAATGPGSEAFHGHLDNTDVYRILAARISESPIK